MIDKRDCQFTGEAPNAIAQGREPGLSGEASLGATGYTAGEKNATP